MSPRPALANRFLLLVRSSLLLALALSLGAVAAGQPPTAARPWNRAEGSRALLESLGISLAEIQDSAPPGPTDHELKLRLLSRLRQLPLALRETWARSAPSWNALLQDPAAFRGETFPLAGDLLSIELIPIDPPLAERFDARTLYRLEIASRDHVGQPIEIWTTQIPAAWKNYPEGAATPIAAPALFLRLGAPDDDAAADALAPLIFVAPKVGWFPFSPSEALSITPSLAALGKAGFDIGLLDAVRQETAKRITAEVTEPFLRMLAAQARFEPEIDSAVEAPDDAAPLDVAPLLAHPERYAGQAFTFEAIARRVVVVPLEKKEDQQRLGADRYYQIDLVIPKPIRTRVRGEDGVEREVEQNQFPLTVCTLAPLEDAEIGADLRLPVRATAFFFKLWAYESKFAEAQSASALQVSPLFLAAKVERAPEPEKTDSSPLWLLGGGALVLAFIVIWGFLLLRRDDQQEARGRTAARRAAPPPDARKAPDAPPASPPSDSAP